MRVAPFSAPIIPVSRKVFLLLIIEEREALGGLALCGQSITQVLQNLDKRGLHTLLATYRQARRKDQHHQWNRGRHTSSRRSKAQQN